MTQQFPDELVEIAALEAEARYPGAAGGLHVGGLVADHEAFRGIDAVVGDGPRGARGPSPRGAPIILR